MWAARMYGVDDVRVERVPTPNIGDDELLVKVRSVGICGTDLRMIKNGFTGIGPNAPRILGHEIGGVIEKIGCKVANYKIGMRVGIAPNMGCGICERCARGDQHLCERYEALGIQMDGGFAEYVRIPAKAIAFGNVIELGDHVSYEEAAINEPLSCVYNGIMQCPIAAGDNVLIIGAGPIGIMYAQMAKMSGAANVMITNRSSERLRLCQEIDGSFYTIEADQVRNRVMELTNGKGADVCVTANPSPEAQQLAIDLAAMHGKINFFGGLPKDRQMVSLNTNDIHYKQLLVTGSTKANNHHFRKTLQFISNGILEVGKLISAKYPIERAGDAIQYAMSSQGVKTLLVFD